MCHSIITIWTAGSEKHVWNLMQRNLKFDSMCCLIFAEEELIRKQGENLEKVEKMLNLLNSEHIKGGRNSVIFIGWMWPGLVGLVSYKCTVEVWYNTVNFLQNTYSTSHWLCTELTLCYSQLMVNLNQDYSFSTELFLCYCGLFHQFFVDLLNVFPHIHQGCFTGTRAIIRLPRCQWSNPDGYREKIPKSMI